MGLSAIPPVLFEKGCMALTMTAGRAVLAKPQVTHWPCYGTILFYTSCCRMESCSLAVTLHRSQHCTVLRWTLRGCYMREVTELFILVDSSEVHDD